MGGQGSGRKSKPWQPGPRYGGRSAEKNVGSLQARIESLKKDMPESKWLALAEAAIPIIEDHIQKRDLSEHLASRCIGSAEYFCDQAEKLARFPGEPEEKKEIV